VLEIDGKPVRDTPSLLARIAELVPGSTSKVKVMRERRVVDVELTPGKRPRPQEQ
jgi:serine protease DegQ